ncbi:uncharacterized protein LTR77_002551 [Saxophila tyrrhenica]|uniref:Uncharacterized protein n=1 Tax=Saxophila tyrrhenica TaxID=1690608 RepID=A0AAV9PJI8_9PEZI|nr:hypothetical protein LTR77_002551 [Saxophila tyrrhenica]
MADPPPRPPPHGQQPRPPGAMPDGNYDIFIIPPHSAGSGFLYLPSLAVQRNSFLAGVAATLLSVGLYTLVMPAVKQWMNTLMASGGVGVLLLVIGVGVAGWAWGRTQTETQGGSGNAGGSAGGGTHQQHSYEPPPKANGWAPPPQPEPQPQPEPEPQPPPPPPPPPKPEPKPKPATASGWEKAREETRKREEARKKEEETKRKAEEFRKMREEAERAAKAKAEKEKWEQARAREKEQREREARERIARERMAREKEAREKDTREREAREKAASAAPSKPRSTPVKPSASASAYRKPTAHSVENEEYSFRPYDSAPSQTRNRRPAHQSSASSVSGVSESSFAPSATTARTTPPPSHRSGPYSTKDPDKIMLKAVYLFSDSHPLKPSASLLASTGAVTDGLILHIRTDGLFIDDDVRGVPQREWDVKAWTLKLVEDGMTKGGDGRGLHVVRASTRDMENKKYVFVLEETEAWKVAVGLARLRKGSQVRALGMSGMKEGEVRGLLGGLGWV